MEYFKVLTEEEHMTKSAHLLNTTQPNLSHAIKDLEKELNVKLFRKSGRNIKLTKYGRMFYITTSNVLFDLNKGIQDLQETIHPTRETIDFGFTYTMSLGKAPFLIREFKKIKEFENIHFSLVQSNSTQLIELLLKEEIDLALCSKISTDPRIQYIPFVEEEIVLIVPKDHPLAVHDEVDLEITQPYPFIYFNEVSGIRPTMDAIFKEADFSPNIMYEVEEDNAMASFVSQDFGIALIPNIPTLSAFEVKIIKIKKPRFKRYLYIATLKQGFISPALMSFLDFLDDHNEVEE